jgi:diguanylate cyclase
MIVFPIGPFISPETGGRMRYQDTQAASAEIFRMVLKKLTELGMSFTPVHYSVLYEYVSGINPPLKEALEDLINSKKGSSDQDMENIFVNHLVPEFLGQLLSNQEGYSKDLQNLLRRLSDSTSATIQDVSKFQEGLESTKTTLEGSGSLDPPLLLKIVKKTLSETDSMKQSTSILEGRLKESQSEIDRLQKELRSAKIAALIDPLTELLNRRGLEQEISNWISLNVDKKEPCSFLMVDIDHFKKINDSHGHLLGDKVIQSVAKALRYNVRDEDIVARVGGEEFAVVLPRINTHQGYIVAEQIRKYVEKIEILSSKTRQKIGTITVSIGLDTLKEGGNWHQSLDRADKALYQSKTGGRNRTSVFYDGK